MKLGRSYDATPFVKRDPREETSRHSSLKSCHAVTEHVPELRVAQGPGRRQGRLAVVPVQEKQRERAHDQEEEDPDPEAGVVLDRLERQHAGGRV